MRFTVCTFNLWGEHLWEARRRTLISFLQKHRPDILCVQELRPKTTRTILEAIPEYESVQDAFGGWAAESNIFWNRDLFSEVDHEAADVGIQEELRRLFCVQLAPVRGGPAITVATAHYTWRENDREKADGFNPRLEQARRTVEHLSQRAAQDDPVILLGDLNDSMHALRLLIAGGFQETFAALGRDPVPTWPVSVIQSGVPELDDWILFRGPLLPMMVDVPDFFTDGRPASDHKPVLACFRLAGQRPAEKTGRTL